MEEAGRAEDEREGGETEDREVRLRWSQDATDD